MFIQQISAFVENKSGTLAEITDVLLQSKIDIRALSIADTTDFGILRMIVSAPDLALAALKDAGITVSVTDVIAVAVDDAPGGLHGVLAILSEANIGLEYAYAFTGRLAASSAYVILRVGDNKAAVTALQAGGITLLTTDEVYAL